jgi:hypothetical protein
MPKPQIQQHNTLDGKHTLRSSTEWAQFGARRHHFVVSWSRFGARPRGKVRQGRGDPFRIAPRRRVPALFFAVSDEIFIRCCYVGFSTQIKSSFSNAWMAFCCSGITA